MSKRMFHQIKKPLRHALRIFFRIFGWLLLAAVLLALAGVAWLAANGWLLYKESTAAKSIPDRVAEVRSRADYIPLEDLPALYPKTVVAVEDSRFYHHVGFDPISIGRALVVNLYTRSYAEGGSTITQQLAKNLCFTQEKALVRKFAELFAAHELEERYTKDEILELYINTIYYGSGYTGIEAAARGDFGVGAAYLTPVQCTLLAGLPQAPTRYSPDNAPALTLQRQAEVVNRLRRDGILSDREAEHLLETAPMALHRWLQDPAA